MSEKVNHFICPTCGHDFYTECAYATCDACSTHFYAAQSLTCQRAAHSSHAIRIESPYDLSQGRKGFRR